LKPSKNAWAVALGSIVGFFISNVFAVLGSRVIVKRISVRKGTFETLAIVVLNLTPQ